MPLDNERISSNVERVVKRGACPLSKRSPSRRIYSIPSKEQSLSFPGLRNSDQRCTVLLVAVDRDSWKLCLVPLFIFLQGTEGRNQSGSEADSSADFLESLEHRSSFPECPGSAESSTASSSSGTSILGKSRNRGKWSKSVKSFSCNCHANTVLNSTSGSGFDVVSSGESGNSISEVEKHVRKNSRKKRKKKGKQYKRSAQKKVLVLSQCGEGNYQESVSETTISSHPSSSGGHISQDMLEKVTSPSSLVRDAEEDNSAESSSINKSATVLACMSYNDEMYNSEPVAPLPLWGLSGDKLIYGDSSRGKNLNHATLSYSTISSEMILSTSSGSTSNIHPKQNGICDTSEIILSASSGNTSIVNSKQNESTSSIFHDQNSSSDLNSFLSKLKIDPFEKFNAVEDSGNASKQSPVKDKYACTFSEGELVFNSVEHNAPCQSITAGSCDRSIEMSGYCSMGSPDLLKYFVDADSTNERVQCSSEASSSDDFHPVVYKNKGRLGRKASFNSNCLHRSGSLNLHGQDGKDSYHPTWPKVQKDGRDGCICGSENDNLVYHHVDISSKGSEVWEKVKGWKQNAHRPFCSCPCSDGKFVKTSDVDPIQSESSGVDSNDLLSKTVDGRLQISPEKLKGKPSSASNQECQGFMKELQSSKISMEGKSEIHVRKGVEMSLQVINHQKVGSQLISLSTTESRSAGIMPANTLDCSQSETLQDKQVNTLKAQNEIRSLPTESDLLEETYTKVHSSSGIIDNEDSQSMKLETESMHSDKSPAVPITSDPAAEMLNSGNELELPISNSPHLVLSDNGGLPCLNSHSEGADLTYSPPPEVDELSCRVRSHLFPMDKSSDVVEKEAHSVTGFETDLCKIMQAIDESYKFLTASEAIRLMTGSSLAEFERLLHSSSPNISQSIGSCKTCSRDQIIGDTLCIHQVPHISLGNLWQWYEKPGSYGLEVKVEDCHNSKRTRNGCSQFHAYFVPYLSAIQLFAQSRSLGCSNNAVSNREAKEFCEEDKALKSSCSLESLPIFKMLLPRPCKEVVPSGNDENYCQTFSTSIWTDEELLFEYFEADQPQQRRPLFEKIKELVRGDTSCNCQMFGDPSKLESLNLHDLHPASWFSVAWYPIYRIPDGNFRAAFLTYHSLGHFVHRRTAHNVTGDITQIVSPVVGMQSYNAKGECWFVQRGSSSNVGHLGKAISPNRTEILNERLRTLEHASSVMARATVRKGNQKSVNRHPDYEFFLSRRR